MKKTITAACLFMIAVASTQTLNSFIESYTIEVDGTVIHETLNDNIRTQVLKLPAHYNHDLVVMITRKYVQENKAVFIHPWRYNNEKRNYETAIRYAGIIILLTYATDNHLFITYMVQSDQTKFKPMPEVIGKV